LRRRSRIGTLIIAAAAVFGELQSALNLIWKAPPSGGLGLRHLIKWRLVSLSVILVIGFLLLVSLVISTALAADVTRARDHPARSASDTLLCIHNHTLCDDIQNTAG
jgi:uncharacterized BrkB/YihY/UPF0761 family membrane protein